MRIAAVAAGFLALLAQPALAQDIAIDDSPRPAYEDFFAKDETPIAELRRRVDGGDVVAMVLLARHYLKGDGIEENDAEAGRLLRAAAATGDPVAMRDLAGFLFYPHGQETTQADRDEAEVWFRRAAEAGDMAAMEHLAIGYAVGRGSDTPESRREAAKWYEGAARKGSLEAMRALADLYARDDESGPAEPEKERLWRRQLAQRGDENDVLRLKDFEEMQAFLKLTPAQQEAQRRAEAAVRWAATEGKAEAGDIDAMRQVAEGYEGGWIGGAPNPEAARHWFERAAAAGDTSAAYDLIRLLREGVGGPRDPVEADRLERELNRRWIAEQTERANAGEEYAAWALIPQYLTGKDRSGEPGVTGLNPAEALRLLRLRAEAGDQQAMGLLRDLLAAGTLVPKDEVESRKWAARIAAIPAGQLEDSMRPVEDLIERAKAGSPLEFFMVANRLAFEGRGDEAIRWLYVGKLRWRFNRAAHPQESGEDQAFAMMDGFISAPLVQWAAGDIDRLVANIDWAIAWEEANENPLTSRTEFPDAWLKTRKEFVDLRDQLLRDKDKIRAERAASGLEDSP